MTDVSPLSVGMNPYPIPTQESCQCIPADFQFPRHLRLTGSRLQHSLNFSSFPVSLYFELCPPMGRPNFCPEAILRASPSRVRWEIKSRSICAEREKRMPIFEIVYYFPVHISLSP